MSRLEGRTAIVTGAARGIGAAYARRLAAEGASVMVTDVLDTAATVAAISQDGGTAHGMTVDVTDDESLGSMTEIALSKYGTIDICVANAALFGDLRHQPFMDIDLDEWDRVMAINVRGVFQTVRAVIPQMRRQQYGKIITVASGTVFKGVPMMLHYVSSKGAILAFTRALAREVGDDNICVNAIAPGLTMSERLAHDPHWLALKDANAATRAFKRDETPDDLVGTVAFLASADSDFMTGQTLVVDGGSAMH